MSSLSFHYCRTFCTISVTWSAVHSEWNSSAQLIINLYKICSSPVHPGTLCIYLPSASDAEDSSSVIWPFTTGSSSEGDEGALPWEPSSLFLSTLSLRIFLPLPENTVVRPVDWWVGLKVIPAFSSERSCLLLRPGCVMLNIFCPSDGERGGDNILLGFLLSSGIVFRREEIGIIIVSQLGTGPLLQGEPTDSFLFCVVPVSMLPDLTLLVLQ